MIGKLISAVAGAGVIFATTGALAAERYLAIKNGETLELNRLYWVSQCKSILKSIPVAEIISGPSQLTANVKEAMALPLAQKCTKEVKGAILSLTATGVTEVTTGKVILRWKYSTLDGDRHGSETLNVTMVP